MKSFIFLNESTYLGNDIHVDTYYLLALTGRNLINLLCYAYASFFLALRDKLPQFRRNWLATMNSLGSLRLPPYIYSPVRFIPAIGVMSGAHYRTLLMFFTSPTRSRSSWGPQIAILVRWILDTTRDIIIQQLRQLDSTTSYLDQRSRTIISAQINTLGRRGKSIADRCLKGCEEQRRLPAGAQANWSEGWRLGEGL